ncbi:MULTISPECIES: four helix bundle protein [Ruminococcus]|uniref:Four helix bundle protein n=1 Tax=Ruminococcus flavefaciens TaxID=1265 RepID=A0A315YNK1_RUMFL|nr:MULTISPECIES: four helix bundle protein [Ruminococcus]MBQ6168978.1 four helix bundle protein [Ruminococcus sp.]MBQ6251925.1 four helix bundle protein [Ruminococcus sp.]MBR1431169.1 four helix bundle protein [Ruminococcus sp.]MBR1433441.1 four helix bundle protein [Ruminococcus sp.]PWJ13462.1 four helix bundle protein [Ruminococcus flavefaciens]
MSNSIVGEKSFRFAVRTVNLYKYLYEKKEYVLSRQILRSGTSIGANISEALEAQSDKDFLSKMCIALKETAETIYWLRLLHETEYITDIQFTSMNRDACELKAILSSIIKTKRSRMESGEDE